MLALSDAHRILHLGLDPAGTDGVHPYTAPTPLRRQGAREPYKSVLARAVRRSIRNAKEPRDGADVHDVSGAPLQHLLAELAAHKKRTRKVHLQDAPPVR
jgi:hypothetical protein